VADEPRHPPLDKVRFRKYHGVKDGRKEDTLSSNPFRRLQTVELKGEWSDVLPFSPLHL